jgi:hypothetical protein
MAVAIDEDFVRNRYEKSKWLIAVGLVDVDVDVDVVVSIMINNKARGIVNNWEHTTFRSTMLDISKTGGRRRYVMVVVSLVVVVVVFAGMKHRP